MDTLLQDLRYGYRMLLKNPGSTAVAVVALALGIGANSAIFSVVNGVLLRPLRYKDPERLVILWKTNPGKGIPQFLVAPHDFKDWVEQNRVFDSIAALRPRPGVLTGGETPERVETAWVSPSLFPLLGARASLGRTFLPEEEQPGHNRVMVLSYGLWQRRFGGDPKILGKALTMDGGSYAVVGVMDREFHLPDTPAELWAPYALDAKELGQGRAYTLKVIGHLKAGVTLEQAGDDMRAIARRQEEQYPDFNAGWSVKLVPLQEQLVGDIRPTLLVLLGAVVFVLLIACANVANLLLARAGTREREIAIRTALGAGPLRVIRQLLTESVLLGVAGGAVGLLLAYWGVSALVALAPANIPRLQEITMDGRVLAFTALISVVTGIIFGLAPALSAARTDLNTTLKTAGRSGMASAQRRLARSLLVVGEVASSLVLVIGAGLLIRSFLRLQQVNPGFRPDHVLTMQLTLPAARYSGLRVALFYKQLLERVRALPGVQVASVARNVPLSGSDPSLNFVKEHAPAVSSAEQPRARYRAASEDYFAAMGIPLIQGRYFERSDAERAPSVAIINETMARRFWPGPEGAPGPIGKRLKAGFDESPWSTIVGVVGDVRHAGLDAEAAAEMYYPYLQVPEALMNFVEGAMTLVVRTAGDPSAMVGAVRNEVRQLDADLPVFNVKTMQEMVRGTVAQPRFRTLLLGIFASVALVLAAVGLYGVMAYSVTQRTNELGIRMALGAQKSDVLKLVVRQGVRLAVAGVALGVVVAFGLMRVISNLLYGVNAADPLTFLATSLLLIVVALVASYIPARRATQIDPLIALRYE